MVRQLHTARWLNPGTYWVEGWVGPIASLDAFRPKEISCSCRESNQDYRLSSLRSSKSAGWATPGLTVVIVFVGFGSIRGLRTNCFETSRSSSYSQSQHWHTYFQHNTPSSFLPQYARTGTHTHTHTHTHTQAGTSQLTLTFPTDAVTSRDVRMCHCRMHKTVIS